MTTNRSGLEQRQALVQGITDTKVTVEPAFGSFALPPLLESLRQLGARIPIYGVRSAVRKFIKARRNAPYDVELVEGVKARLNPWNNVCEKRAMCGAAYFDAPELIYLRRQITASDRSNFTFLDVGSNVGFYSLFLRASAKRAGVAFSALAIEPDPVNAQGLLDNLALNEIGEDEIMHVPWAVSDTVGEVRFVSGGLHNRGMARIGEGDIVVQVKPLVVILKDAGITSIDAMKVDIEGHEIPALSHFFRNASQDLLPTVIVAEMVHNDEQLPRLLESNGYQIEFHADVNTVFRRRTAHHA